MVSRRQTVNLFNFLKIIVGSNPTFFIVEKLVCRSKLKGPFIKNLAFSKNNRVIVNRSYEIVPKFVGFSFSIYNGKNFSNLIVKEKMIGHKFGEFCFTKFKAYGKKN